MTLAIRNGSVLLASGETVVADVEIADGRIAEVGHAVGGGRTLDASGLLVLPGIVDVHGDGFERSIMPRPGVSFDHAVAFGEADRVMVAYGITTGYLGLTLSWEPGLRSLAAGREIMTALAAARQGFAADLRVQIRWETYALDAVDDIIGWLDGRPTPVLAFNDHTTKTLESRRDTKKLNKWAERCGLTVEGYLALAEEVAAGRAKIPAAMEKLAAAARTRGIVMLSHDDQTTEDRAFYRRLGCSVAEFPLTRAAIEDAKAHREPTVLGAPNVLRGGSHTGALGATEMVEAGLCDVLASDYYYPSPLMAAFKLVRENGLAIGRVWPLVSTNAARAMGLDDRGVIAPGQRADIVVVDASGPLPQAVATLVEGRLVHLARDLGA